MPNGNGVHLVDCEREITPLAGRTDLRLTATVYEVGGDSPTQIIRTDQDWYVDVEWTLTGPLRHHFCGKWYVSVQLESIGPGPEYRFPVPAAEIDMEPCGDGTYSYRINVPAGEVDAADPDGTVYIVSVTLGSENACGDPGHLRAHCTGDEIHFVPGPST